MPSARCPVLGPSEIDREGSDVGALVLIRQQRWF